MSDSLEKLAMSSTLVMRGSILELVEDSGFSSARDFLPGDVLDSKYKLIELIGTGGMGAVYKVHHLALQKDMALKTFRSRSLSENSWHRFQREARAIGRLTHNNIVQVFDFGIVQDHRPYYTMELLSGESLAERLKRKGRMEPIKVLHIFLQAAEALAYAHRQQIVHRDIKPANIFLQKQQDARGTSFHVKLVDFGIAKLAEDSSSKENQALTQSGLVFGSPLYMSPEQSLGKPVDQRTDIYSFGCALFESIVGHAPFIGETILQTLLLHQTKNPPSLQEVLPKEVFPQRIEDILKKLLAKNPVRRYQSFDEVISEIKFAIEDLSVISAYSRPASNNLPGQSNAEAEVFNASGLPQINETTGENTSESTGQTTIAVRSVKRRMLFGATIVIILAGLVITVLLHGNTPAAKEPKPILPRAHAEALSPTDSSLAEDIFKRERVQASADPSPYFQGSRNGWKFFKFPSYRSIGVILPDDKMDPIQCIKSVKIRQDKLIIFSAQSEVFLAPTLLDRFQPDDLFGLELPTAELSEILWRNDQLNHITRLKSLQVLNVAHNEYLTNQAIKFINDLPNLKYLDVSASAIDGNGLIQLKTLPTLTALIANDTKHTDELLTFIDKAPSKYALEKLTINHCNVSDEQLRNLRQLKLLKYLSLSDNPINGSTFKYLAALPELRSLEVERNDIAPENIKELARLSTLKVLTLSAGRASKADIDQLQKQLPKCTIHLTPNDARRKQQLEAFE